MDSSEHGIRYWESLVPQHDPELVISRSEKLLEALCNFAGGGVIVYTACLNYLWETTTDTNPLDKDSTRNREEQAQRMVSILAGTVKPSYHMERWTIATGVMQKYVLPLVWEGWPKQRA